MCMSRTNIVLDDDLVRDAMRITQARSKRELVEIALRRIVDNAEIHRELSKLRGKNVWQGDVGSWRRART